MSTCLVCRFAIPLDDTAVRTPHGTCICLRCYTRLTDTARVMPSWLRRAVQDTMADVP